MFMMKSTIFAMISAIALASATDVQVTLGENTYGVLSQTLMLASGTCRESGVFGVSPDCMLSLWALCRRPRIWLRQENIKHLS